MQEKKLWSQIALEESDEEKTNQSNPIEPPQLINQLSQTSYKNNNTNRKKQSKQKKQNPRRDLIGQIEQLLMSFSTDELQIRVKSYDYVNFNELANFFENEFVDVKAIIQRQQQNSSLELIASPQAAIEILRNCGIKPRILGYNLTLQFPQVVDEPIHPSLKFKKSYSQPEPPKQQPVIKFQRGTQVETPIIQPADNNSNSTSLSQVQVVEEPPQVALVKTQSEIIQPNKQDQPNNQERKYNNYRDRDRRNFDRNYNKPGQYNKQYSNQGQRVQYIEKNQQNDQNNEDVCETPIQPNRDEEHEKYGLQTPKKEKEQVETPLQQQEEVQNQSGDEEETTQQENLKEELPQKKKKKKNKKKTQNSLGNNFFSPLSK